MRTLRPLPATLLGMVGAGVIATVVLQVLLIRAGGSLALVSPTAPLGGVMATCGAVVASRRPGHLVGHVLIAFGMLWAIDGLLEAWHAIGITPPYGSPPDEALPGTAFSYWFVARAGAFLLVGLPLVLLLYPTGQLISGRWRGLALGTIGASALLPLMLVVTPAAVLELGMPPPAVPDPDLLSLPIPASWGFPLLVAVRAVSIGAVLPALVLVSVRYRRADEVERRQLRWLLWAGVICVFLAIIGVLVPGSLIATIALSVAVATTSISVMVGICFPDVLDVDALVADTLAWGAVAGVVVGLDLLLVAGASRLLGDALNQREVLIVVLLLAVMLYAPLRTLLWDRVRRLMLGRRSDRYGVVSELAARLETSGSVADQLPALAGTVAESFKLPYVGVEVFAPDGGALMAEHGRRPERVTELPIAYSEQTVGRLLLADRGIRSMLTHRDQMLLMDVVRQAAIAVRHTTLAEELQASREHLVLAREDDRRRIRRDLHDGLGPVLGGVGLRLAAAAQAVDDDPDRAKQLIATSREDLHTAVGDVRRLVHGLRPPALDDLGLLAAVHQQVDIARAAGLQIEVDAADLGALPAAVEVAAYRILAEALTNATTHARAQKVVVRLAYEPGGLAVEVCDDGIGISSERLAGVGLLSLRERAAELGGRTTVSCPPGGGTVVRALLPLPAQPRPGGDRT